MGAQDQRPRFYEGQYLGAQDLAAIVDYLRGADARHALGAHTWGIAIGLYLIERPAPGGADRREVILTPGVAWDGFGRAIVCTRPTRLAEDLFAAIPYDALLDGASAKGRGVRVWLNYKETAAQLPAPGFESCSDQDQNARVAESFDFVVGSYSPGPNRQGNVAIGTETLQAEEALTRFDGAALPLYDASVPHQSFPTAKVPRWLVPVGYVRWIARDGDLGYFVSRDGAPEYRLKDCTRAFRRYIGAVVENVVAADGAIVLQRRDKDPRGRHKLAWLLNCGRSADELLADLAWVEGNLRVVGDAKLARGKLLMRDADGDDEGVPIYLDRVGDDPQIDSKKCCEDLDSSAGGPSADDKAKQPREFRAAIGKKGQNEHRWIVGPEVAGATPQDPPTLAPRFVVLSGTGHTDNKDSEGRAGVNTRDPNAALEVKGDWNKEDGAVRVAGTQPTIRYEGGADVDNLKWLTQITTQPKGAFCIAYRKAPANPGDDPTWPAVLNVLSNPERVGIRSGDPKAPLAVKADGDGQDLVAFEDNAGGTQWKIRLKPDANHTGLTFSDPASGANAVFLKPGGDVGIGTLDPQGRLSVYGKVQPAQGMLSLFTASADIQYDGGNDQVFIFQQSPAGITSFLGAKVGIGGTTPYAALSVRGAGTTEELVSFENAAGTTRWHINQNLAAAPVKGFNIAETGVADGRLFIRLGGDVGIGTYDPKDRLHVAGNFLRVNGAGGEQAYIGGDGSSNVYGQDVQIGSAKSGVGNVHFWNRADSDWMWLSCKQISHISDARHKTHVETLSGALAHVTRLRGVRFKWKPARGSDAPSRPGLGVIAQEVAEVLPELVHEMRGDLTVSYAEMVPLLIEAVKELKGQVDELREEVKHLSDAAPKKKAPRG
jgi:hypothetical protein